MRKGDQLKWQSARFAFERHRDRDTDTPIGYYLQLFSLPISTQVCCAKQKRLKNRNNIFRGISSSGRALNSHSRGTAIETPILQLVILYNYFHCQFQRKFVVQHRKGWRIEKLSKGNYLKWQSAHSHSRGTGIDARILQLVFLYNCFRCQLQHKFFVPNRKVWRIEKMCKWGQLKWQNAGFAFERHRDRYPDSPISFSLQLFSLPIATQVFCAKQKSLENRRNVQGRLAQVVERSIRIREAPGSRHGYSNWLFVTIIFIANFNASLLCQTEKFGEKKQSTRGIS